MTSNQKYGAHLICASSSIAYLVIMIILMITNIFTYKEIDYVPSINICFITASIFGVLAIILED